MCPGPSQNPKNLAGLNLGPGGAGALGPRRTPSAGRHCHELMWFRCECVRIKANEGLEMRVWGIGVWEIRFKA